MSEPRITLDADGLFDSLNDGYRSATTPETVKALVEERNKAQARIRDLEQFASDIANKLNIPYEPPVAKGECKYLVALEGLKERAEKAEADAARLTGDLEVVRGELHRLRASIGPHHCDKHERFSAGCSECRPAQREAENERLREELAKANGLYSECLRGNQALRQQAKEANREREEERCAASALKLKLEGQIDDAVGVILRAKEQYRTAQDAKRKAEENELSAAAELDEAKAQLNAHRRFHSKVGCPGGQDCYVCVLELEQEILEHGDALSGDDYQAMQNLRDRQAAPTKEGETK
jgi:hypothetical protein